MMITCKVTVSLHPVQGLHVTLVSVSHPALRFFATTGLDGSISEWLLSGDGLDKRLYYALADGTPWVLIFPTFRFLQLPNLEVKIDTRSETRHDICLSLNQGKHFVRSTVTRAPVELRRLNVNGEPFYENSRLMARAPLPAVLAPCPLPLSLPSPGPVPNCLITEEAVVSGSAGRQAGGTSGVNNVKKPARIMGTSAPARRSNRLRAKEHGEDIAWAF
jgi:hypothetical protein